MEGEKVGFELALSLATAAARAKVPVKVLRAEKAAGRLKTIQIGTRTSVVRPGDLERWVRRHRPNYYLPLSVMEEATVYRLYDRKLNLLYVGVTGNLAARLKAHAKTQPWWKKVGSVRLEQHTSREDAERAEALAILEESPAYNRARPAYHAEP